MEGTFLKMVLRIAENIFYAYSMLVAIFIITMICYNDPQSMRDKLFIIGFFLMQLLILGIIYDQIYRRTIKRIKKAIGEEQQDKIKAKKNTIFLISLIFGILACWIMILSF